MESNRRMNIDFNSIYAIFFMVLLIFALYLSFKCNNGLDLGSFLMALFFPYIYVPYKLAVSGTC